MSKMNIELEQSETKILLEALVALEKKYVEICNSSEDEDEVADFGNDLIELRLLLNPLKEKAVKIFGKDVLNFSREPL